MSAPMLIAEGLKRCFVRPAQGGLHEVLRGASLRVTPGEAVAIVTNYAIAVAMFQVFAGAAATVSSLCFVGISGMRSRLSAS